MDVYYYNVSGLFHNAGTELRQRLIYEPQVRTPAGLKEALEDPILLQTYILDADVVNATSELGHILAQKDEHDNVIPSKFGGKRRIDYILFKEEDGVVRRLSMQDYFRILLNIIIL